MDKDANFRRQDNLDALLWEQLRGQVNLLTAVSPEATLWDSANEQLFRTWRKAKMRGLI